MRGNLFTAYNTVTVCKEGDRVKKDPIHQPVKCKPYLKETVWAGQRLGARYGGGKIGEAYLLSAVQGQASGTWEGNSFFTYLEQSQRDPKKFPLLIKAIDAKEPLSVQVHPKETAAKKTGGKSKNELWIIDRCREGAAVFVGFREAVSVLDIVRRCADGTVLSLLNRIPVSGGEVIFVPAGTVHAIGGSVSLYEIQENADVTYRLYDYGRGRATQLEQALAVLERKRTTPLTGILENGPLFLGEEGFPFAVAHCCFLGDVCCAARKDAAVLFLAGSGRFLADGYEGEYTAGDCFFLPQNSCFTLLGQGEALHIAAKG